MRFVFFATVSCSANYIPKTVIAYYLSPLAYQSLLLLQALKMLTIVIYFYENISWLQKTKLLADLTGKLIIPLENFLNYVFKLLYYCIFGLFNFNLFLREQYNQTYLFWTSYAIIHYNLS